MILSLPLAGRGCPGKIDAIGSTSMGFPLARREAMGEGGRRPGGALPVCPYSGEDDFCSKMKSDMVIELEQRALIRPLAFAKPRLRFGGARSGTFSHATARGRRGKFGTSASRMTKFNTHHCFDWHFTSARQLSPDSPAQGEEGEGGRQVAKGEGFDP